MSEQMTFEFAQRETIKGFPELRWTGKRPYRVTQYFPAQLREKYGEEKDGWINKIFWGDNLQVMSHMLKDYRGKINLIYIDPPFDSKADYKKKIEVKGIGKTETDSSSFEEKQYGDIWTNDEYLQFMYERLIILRDLLSDSGTIYLHCDWHKVHHLRILLDSHVRPWVYLLSLVIMTQITMWVTVMISLPLLNLDYQYLGSIFGMIFHFSMCFLISSILGLIFGLIFDRSATANAASMVPMLAIAFIPLFSRMNDHLAGLMPYFYTGRANAWLLHLDYGGLGMDLLVDGVWLLASLIVLTICYRQKRKRIYL